MFFDLHRHDEFSTFDGFGKASELAKLAAKLGYKALGISNHGNSNGLVQHYFACKENNIKPIMGVEVYFQPHFDKEKDRYHLCLFAKDLQGYRNLNKILFEAESQKYYFPIVTFDILENNSDGLICTSACLAGFISRMIESNKIKVAEKAIRRFKKIFKDDFYIEIQPYKTDDEGTQQRVNDKLIELAEENGIECILTSDSHYGTLDDWDTYQKMHEIGKHNYDIQMTYGERYMPTKEEMIKRCKSMGYSKKFVESTFKSLESIYDKVDGNILELLPMELPEFIEGKNSYDILVEHVKDGLKRRGKFKKKYISRCKEELEIIEAHGFADYFLIVADYVNHAKEKGIVVGPGRGSVCNCEVAYALGITEVDSLKYKLDFRRFLRLDKKKLPDIDLDFETSRRDEVIDYLVKKYPSHAAQICSYGLYKIDNLINDLAKVCNVTDEKEKKAIKEFIKKFEHDDDLDLARLLQDGYSKRLNKMYDNIIIHFSKLYKKVRFIGTHAAGVAITSANLLDYSAMRISKDGKIYVCYDLADLDKINVAKFDILGLKTMEIIGELRRLTNHEEMNEEWADDPEINKAFGQGFTDGIFQFEKKTAKDILINIESDCFEDVIAASSMNRPGPLSLRTPEAYAENKRNLKLGELEKDAFYEYTKDTYGTLVYQEQLQQICVNIGNMSWSDADKVMKLMKNAIASMGELDEINRNKREMEEKFVEGAKKNGLSESVAREFFHKVLVYAFNKGHGAGYALISVEEMFYKLNHPTEFWYTKVKYAGNDSDAFKFILKAVKDNIVVFLPHVNYSAKTSLRKFEGEYVIQLGLDTIKGVGTKAAEYIENERKTNGFFKSIDDFEERCNGRNVNKSAREKLQENAALEFNKKLYLKRTVKYNSAMLAR